MAEAAVAHSPHTYRVLFRVQRGTARPPPAAPGTAGDEHRLCAEQWVELRARLKLERGQIYLHLTYKPHTDSAAVTHPHFGPPRYSAKPGRHSPPPVPLHRGSAHLHASAPAQPLSMRKKKKKKGTHVAADATTSAAVTSSPTATAPHQHHHHQTQHYAIALKEMAPLAAMLPLSADLRSQLHLNLVDGDAVTYSSHSTPRAVTMRSFAATGSPAAQSALSTNFCLPPSRSQQSAPPRTRDNSLSARGGFSGHVPSLGAYGQYLDVAEPYRTHSRRAPSPTSFSTSIKGASSHHSGSCHGEAEGTLVHRSPRDCVSHPSSGTGSRLLTPLLEKARPPVSIVTAPACGCAGASPTALPPTCAPRSPTQLASNVVVHYEDLHSVTIFGVAETAGVHNCSFSTDDEGHVLVDKKSKRFNYRNFSQALLSWISPPKKDLQRVRSVASVSTPSTLHSPSTPLQPSVGKRLSQTKSTPHASRPPVLASAAHVDPTSVLDLPFTLNEAQTFSLRFTAEASMLDFLHRYVELQARAEELRTKTKAKTARPRPPARRGNAAEWGSDEDGESTNTGEYVAQLRESATDSLGSPSTATYNDYPRNPDATGPSTLPAVKQKSANERLSHTHSPVPSDGGWTEKEGGGGDGLGISTAAAAAATPVPTIFFGSRGWQHFLRHAADPRYGIAFAKVPLFLWHSFLPLAPSVLYTCHRGFLAVEQLPPPTSPTQSDDHNGSGYGTRTEANFSPEASRQRLNTMLGRVLKLMPTGAEAVVSPGLRPSSRQRRTAGRKRHSVVDLLPTPLDPDEAAGSSLSTSSSSEYSWDGVKLVLPGTEVGAGTCSEDHLTTFKDVFLCLSESHVLFLNSFGHLRFQCSIDEIAIVTHSAATDTFPTYPFVRFRLRATESFGAPTFAFTFTLLPDVPYSMRVATTSPTQPRTDAHTVVPARTCVGPSTRRRSDAATPLSAAASVSGTASWASAGTPHASSDASAALNGVNLLEEEQEKKRLLRRQQSLLSIFEVVCTRQLHRCTFTEMMSGDAGKAHRALFAQLTSRAATAVSTTPLLKSATTAAGDASPWMSLQHNAEPILYITVEAGDITFGDASTRSREEGHLGSSPPLLPVAGNVSVSARDRGTSPRRSVAASPALRGSAAALVTGKVVTPRWGRDDPGMVLQDAGRDMDFSLERATRSMPLLAFKEDVCQQYGGPLHDSPPHSLYPTLRSHGFAATAATPEKRAATRSDSRGDAEDAYVPMAPKKRGSLIVHRAAMK
ncbi:hypothetical protein NESM_000214000 [Novymonas esmeraldas]|uniref:Uncharacterized protein n=1 Tax=Novymonas esmeraldas TaxID=1808958 RepID=A0AAW0F6Z7_9TRYP